MITLSNRFYKNFLPKRSHSPGKRQNWILLFYQQCENQHTSKISYPFGVEAAWHTVLICCTMCGTEQPKEQPQTGDRGSNPVAINQFLTSFSLLGPQVLVLFFHLLIFFILRGLLTSFDLILL